MGTASMYGSFSFDVELDCDWMTVDAQVFYTNHSEGVDLNKVIAHGVDITNWINSDYIFDLINDEIENADYHWSDHGDAA